MTKRGRWWKEKAVEKKMSRKKIDPSEKKATPSKAAACAETRCCRAQPPKKRRVEHVRAQPPKEEVQAMRGVKSASKTASEAAASCEGSVVEVTCKQYGGSSNREHN